MLVLVVSTATQGTHQLVGMAMSCCFPTSCCLAAQLNMHMQEKLAKKDEEMAETLRAVEEEMARKLAAKEVRPQ